MERITVSDGAIDLWKQVLWCETPLVSKDDDSTPSVKELVDAGYAEVVPGDVFAPLYVRLMDRSLRLSLQEGRLISRMIGYECTKEAALAVARSLDLDRPLETFRRLVELDILRYEKTDNGIKFKIR